MVDPVQAELLHWAQASVGWGLLAARKALTQASGPVRDPEPELQAKPMRFRATITIDIDAHDADDAERQAQAVRGGFEMLKDVHPSAALAIQRRKPRVGARAPAPTLMIAPYDDD